MATKKALSKKKINLPKEEQDTLCSMFYCTWEAIAADALDLGPLNNKNAVAMCFDYVDMYGNDRDGEGRKLLNVLIKEHSYDEVLKFLAKHVRLG